MKENTKEMTANDFLYNSPTSMEAVRIPFGYKILWKLKSFMKNGLVFTSLYTFELSLNYPQNPVQCKCYVSS